VSRAEEQGLLGEQLKSELAASQKLVEAQKVSEASGSKKVIEYEDFALPDSSAGLQNAESNLILFKQTIEELALNDKRTPAPENKAFNQLEANLLVKYFLKLNINPDSVLSMRFQGSLDIKNVRDKAQAIQTINNIANTRKDMNLYLALSDVRCFYRNYFDPNAVFNNLRLSDSLKKDPLTEIFKRSDDVTIVGKCRGCGLLKLDEFSMTAEQREQYSACSQ
jgi:hypothetical protein